VRESKIQKEIFTEIGGLDSCRLFRNTVGMAFHGESINQIKIGNGKYIKVPYGILCLRAPRAVTVGLFKGSSDLIGYTRKKITPDMVGQTVAIFTAIEIKRPGKKPTKEQKNWIQKILDWGGFAGRAESKEEAAEIIK